MFCILDGDEIIEGLGDIQKPTSRHLTIYIALPICVFLVCIGAVISLIIRNRSRQDRQRSQRNGQKPFFISQGMNRGGDKPSLNSSHRFLDHSSIAGSASMTFTRSGSPHHRGPSTISSKVPPAAAGLAHMQMRPSPISSTTNTSTSQMFSTQFSPALVQHSPYIYPSPNTECAYLSVNRVPIRPPCTSPPISTYNSPAYRNDHVPNMEFQCCPQIKGVSYPGYPQSGDSSACTSEIGLDPLGNPIMTKGKSVNNQDPQHRNFLCLNPSSGQEGGNNLEALWEMHMAKFSGLQCNLCFFICSITRQRSVNACILFTILKKEDIIRPLPIYSWLPPFIVGNNIRTLGRLCEISQCIFPTDALILHLFSSSFWRLLLWFSTRATRISIRV